MIISGNSGNSGNSDGLYKNKVNKRICLNVI